VSTNLPHEALTNAPILRVDDLLVDGAERPERIEDHLNRIDLTQARGEWRALQLVVSAAADDGEIASLLDQGVEPRATVVVSCPSTNLRLGFPLTRVDTDSEWSTTFNLVLDDLRDEATISAEITADLGGRSARRLGTSQPWHVFVDESAVPPFEGTFRVRWSHFTREQAIPEEAASESFFVDLGGAVPSVHLNQDMDGLYELLAGGADRPAMELALRDAEMRRIATAAWVGAIGTSAAAIRIDPETDEHDWPERPWMADVLRWGLPSIYPTTTADEALKKFRAELLGPQAAVVQGMIQLTVSRQMQAGKLLRGVLKSVAERA
jgi:hypothetical protein